MFWCTCAFCVWPTTGRRCTSACLWVGALPLRAWLPTQPPAPWSPPGNAGSQDRHLQLEAGVSKLTALRSATLTGKSVQLSNAGLSASLTHLRLESVRNGQPLPTVRAAATFEYNGMLYQHAGGVSLVTAVGWASTPQCACILECWPVWQPPCGAGAAWFCTVFCSHFSHSLHAVMAQPR